MGVFKRHAVPGEPGHFTVFLDGIGVGDIYLDHPYAHTLSQEMVLAATDKLTAIANSPGDEPFVLAGWTSRDEYLGENEACTELLAAATPDIRRRAAGVLERHRWCAPLTRSQMSIWQAELLDLLTTNGQETPT